MRKRQLGWVPDVPDGRDFYIRQAGRRQFATRPPARVFAEATKNLAIEYARVPQTLADIQGILAQGLTINLGIAVYDSFYLTGQSGIVAMPGPAEPLLGGHAILLVGYDHPAGMYQFLNSWGHGWGRGGYGYLPFDYVHSQDLAADLWTVRRM